MKNKYLVLLFVLGVLLSSCEQIPIERQALTVLNGQVIKNAEWAMQQVPQTITSFGCDRSTGGIHDFYSEGDYWWPDVENPEGPYVKRDGEINPDNFIEHRLALISFSKVVGYLASAYIATGNEDYVNHAFAHMNAWFTDSLTMMNPNLSNAQAIKGLTSGRCVGIIDSIHLMEVAQSIIRMQNAGCVEKEDLQKIKDWFTDYILWLGNHRNGLDAMNSKNKHGVCWVMQVAIYAKLTENEQMQNFCKLRFKNVLLTELINADGSFPAELSTKRPYGHSLFNLDGLSTICQVLSTREDNLWNYSTYNGLNLRKSIDFMYPFIKDKRLWTYPSDAVSPTDWPMAQPVLIFAACAYQDESYFDLWKRLGQTTDSYEVERLRFIRNPLIWIYKN